jgi:hypothetical protein
LLDFSSYEKISELGYEEARQVFIRHGLISGHISHKERPVTESLPDPYLTGIGATGTGLP